MASNDVLSHLFCNRGFLNQQGYYFSPTLHQDDINAILSETNGMESSIKMTRHTNIQFYFIKNNIICKELNVKQCSTYDMLL